MNKEIIDTFNEIYDLIGINYIKEIEQCEDIDLILPDNDRLYLETISSLEKPTISNFANAIKVSQPAGTQIINRFIKKGYLVKEVSEEDKRVSYIKLSDKIVEHLSLLTKIEEKSWDSILSKLSDTDKDSLLHLFEKIKGIVEEN